MHAWISDTIWEPSSWPAMVMMRWQALWNLVVLGCVTGVAGTAWRGRGVLPGALRKLEEDMLKTLDSGGTSRL
ncbi:hypothetical protein IWX49DRAFT_572046 [Phyllosticta citricarpa]|uniref:uncharacterized protein n=1 Tax=Phyllosticta citriasiana TaxID=595635 RepID=UPI0030FD7BBA